MANRAQFGHLHLWLYSLLFPRDSVTNGCGWSYLEVTPNVHCCTSWLLYIVSTCQIDSVSCERM